MMLGITNATGGVKLMLLRVSAFSRTGSERSVRGDVRTASDVAGLGADGAAEDFAGAAEVVACGAGEGLGIVAAVASAPFGAGSGIAGIAVVAATAFSLAAASDERAALGVAVFSAGWAWPTEETFSSTTGTVSSERVVSATTISFSGVAVSFGEETPVTARMTAVVATLRHPVALVMVLRTILTAYQLLLQRLNRLAFLSRLIS